MPWVTPARWMVPVVVWAAGRRRLSGPGRYRGETIPEAGVPPSAQGLDCWP